MRTTGLVAVLAFVLIAIAGPAAAQTCTSEQLGAEVDAAGAQLRDFNSRNMEALEVDLQKLQKARGWSDAERSQNVAQLFQSDELGEIDRDAYQQYSVIEELSNGPAGPVDCSRVTALQGHVRDLMATMARKREALARMIAAELNPAAQVAAVAEAAPVAPKEPATAGAQPVQPAKPVPKPKPVTAEEPPATGWDAAAVLSPEDATPAQPEIEPSRAGIPGAFTVEEIKDASRGLFGSVSAQLASVIAHAFKNVGQPNGYIMGDEGGGAFLAGVRYGTGKLYLKDGSERRIHWQGPSIGLDVGASGSRTMFLVYNLKRPEDVYGAVSGVDGSAYVVGGIGMTLLSKGDIVMAPISTGLGLRLGANAGYLRFSDKPSWLPF